MGPRSGFEFTTTQKRGIALLILALALIAVARWFWSDTGLGVLPPVTRQQTNATSDRGLTREAPDPIDINLADSAAWASLPGIGPVLSARIINYRSAIGGFDSVGQIAKVYGLKSETFAQIRPWLRCNPEHKPSGKERFAQRDGSKPKPIDINLADSLAWSSLPGIGPVLSSRIIKYRQAIGGFKSVEDLEKVYGLKKETLEEIRPFLELDSTDLQNSIASEPVAQTRALEPAFRPQKVDINLADSASLEALPGIGPVLAHRIVKYREMIGWYAGVDYLQAVYGLSGENLSKARPWLQNTATVPAGFQKKDLNSASTHTLARYPFIDKDQAQEILKHRRQLGRFESWAEVEQLDSLPSQTLQSLQFYFQI